jgi:hypothetical protein
MCRKAAGRRHPTLTLPDVADELARLKGKEPCGEAIRLFSCHGAVVIRTRLGRNSPGSSFTHQSRFKVYTERCTLAPAWQLVEDRPHYVWRTELG